MLGRGRGVKLNPGEIQRVRDKRNGRGSQTCQNQMWGLKSTAVSDEQSRLNVTIFDLLGKLGE